MKKKTKDIITWIFFGIMVVIGILLILRVMRVI